MVSHDIERATAQNLVRAALERTQLPIFVARFGAGNRPVVEVGTLERDKTSSLRRSVSTLLREVGVATGVRVVAHRPAAIKRARSLEQLLGMTGKGGLVFDRTKALQRAEALLALSSRIRGELGAVVNGMFFQSEGRTLFVVLAHAAQSSEQASEILGNNLRRIEPMVAGWRHALGPHAFDVAIRVGFAVPEGLDLIAVDRRTVQATFLTLLRRPIRGNLAKAVIGSLLGAAVTAPTLAAGPAVDGPNITFMKRAGVVNDKVNFEHLWAGIGAKATIPLGEQFGAQLDLGVGTDLYYGAAAHLFARDPELGLVGVLASAESRYGLSMTRLGVEGEYYLNDNLTVSGVAGFQGGTVPNGGFGRLDLRFYPDPNLMLRAGGEIQPTQALARVGFEWLPAVDSLPGLSIFGDGSISSTGDYRALFGLNFQIGAEGTLVERHRRSDPTEAIFNEFDVSGAAYGGL